MTIGDSKLTWYGNTITQSIPDLLYAKYGNVINHGKSGDKTAEVVSTTDEVIALNPRQAIVTIGSNDLRNGVSSGTWQANIDTIYNRYTRAGIEVYFDLMYETDEDQSTLVTYLSSTYPTRYIGAGYTATQNCASCLLADNIHMTAYGNRKWIDAVAQSGMVDFFNPFREMTFRAGDSLYIEVGDSLITNRYFRTTNKLNVFREGELQWEASTYEPYSITRTNDSLYFHPPLSTGERIVIQSYSHVNWVAITPDPPPFEFLLTNFPTGDLGYSVRKLSSTYSGYCLKVRRSSDNAEQDIGFVNNELDTVAMKIFVGANSAYVTKWYNQAVAATNDAVQTTSGSQPRIMNSGVIDRVQNNDGDWVVGILFDGTDDNFTLTGLNLGANWASFMVQKRTAAGQVGGHLSSSGCCVVTPRQFSDNNIQIYNYNTIDGHPYSNFSSSTDATATFCLFEGFNVSNSTSVYKNASSVTMGGQTDLGFGGSFTLNNMGAGSFSNAYITEAIVYSTDKSASRTGIETNINSFWKIY